MTTGTRSSHYDRLGVSPGTDPGELKAAYRRKAKELHPDSGGSEEDFEALQVAWRVLSDPARREIYDSWLFDTQPIGVGSTTRIQQQLDRAEREAERDAWERRRRLARDKADAQAASRADEDAKKAEQREIERYRAVALTAASLVVLVSSMTFLADTGESRVTGSYLGLEFQLPPTDRSTAVVQIALGLAVVAGALLSKTSQRSSSGALGRLRSSVAWRVSVCATAIALAIWVVVPFVLLGWTNAALVPVAAALLAGAILSIDCTLGATARAGRQTR